MQLTGSFRNISIFNYRDKQTKIGATGVVYTTKKKLNFLVFSAYRMSPNPQIWILLSLAAFGSSQSIIEAGIEPLDASATIECHRRLYTYRVTQSDENGKQCWDTLSVMACWGRCDSNEVGQFNVLLTNIQVN